MTTSSHLRMQLTAAAGIFALLLMASALRAQTITDSLEGTTVNPQLWITGSLGSGVTLTPSTEGLIASFPANLLSAYGSQPYVIDSYITLASTITGDFDCQVSYSLLNWPNSNGVRIGLIAYQGSYGTAIERDSFGSNDYSNPATGGAYCADYSLADGRTVFIPEGSNATTGEMRLTRTGYEVSCYYDDSTTDGWTLITTGSFTGDVSINLQAWTDNYAFTNQAVSAAFTNFSISEVPEPSTWAMMAAGIGALLAFGRRRTRIRGIIMAAFGIFALLSTTSALRAQSNFITNGDFEQLTSSGNSSYKGDGLYDWTIPSGGEPDGIDIVPSIANGTDWLAESGTISLSLNWGGPSSVTQQGIATTPGQSYELSFYMAAEIYGGPELRTMNVLWNGTVVGSPSFEYTEQGPTDMGWTEISYTVVGTGDDTLEFQSTTAGTPYGPALDNVSLVQAIPEPATWAMLAAGIAALLAFHRRRASSSVKFTAAFGIFALLLNGPALRAQTDGKIVVDGDEWAFSDDGMSHNAQYINNVVDWFGLTSEDSGENVLILDGQSSNDGYNGTLGAFGSQFRNLLEGSGINVTYVPYNAPIPSLSGYDALFVDGYMTEANPSTLTADMASFVDNGGDVYLAGGTGTFPDPTPSGEAQYWQPFFSLATGHNDFGLVGGANWYDATATVFPVTGTGPIGQNITGMAIFEAQSAEVGSSPNASAAIWDSSNNMLVATWDVPEPSTWVMLAAGATSMLIFRRRR